MALLLRSVLCERAFAHVLDRGGMRHTWLRGRENVAKRYRIEVAAHNLGLLMRALIGAGTPKAATDLHLVWLTAGDHVLLDLRATPTIGSRGPAAPASTAIAIITATPPHDPFSTGC